MYDANPDTSKVSYSNKASNIDPKAMLEFTEEQLRRGGEKIQLGQPPFYVLPPEYVPLIDAYEKGELSWREFWERVLNER